MSKSIADQLLGLGLADKKQIQKDNADKRKQQKQSRKHKSPIDDQAKLEAQAARKEKTEKDRQLNLERQKQAEQKAILAQVRQMIKAAKVESDGEIKFNFVDRLNKKIKFIYVSESIQTDLSKGRLAIATTDNQNYVVTKKVADKIIERSESSILFLNDSKAEEPSEDDPYKDFVIPDDLMW